MFMAQIAGAVMGASITFCTHARLVICPSPGSTYPNLSTAATCICLWVLLAPRNMLKL